VRRGLVCCCFDNTGTGGGLLVGSGSANRTVLDEDLLFTLSSVDCLDFILDFMEDRLGMLDEDNDETLDILLRDDRTDVGVVVPLEVDMMSAR
jgi:hypothetical protein